MSLSEEIAKAIERHIWQNDGSMTVMGLTPVIEPIIKRSIPDVDWEVIVDAIDGELHHDEKQYAIRCWNAYAQARGANSNE